MLLVSLIAQACSALAQSLDQRARCRDLAHQKVMAAFWRRPDIDEASGRVRADEHHSWRYDDGTGRCLGEIEQQEVRKLCGAGSWKQAPTHGSESFGF